MTPDELELLLDRDDEPRRTRRTEQVGGASIDGVLSPRLAARFERTLAAEEQRGRSGAGRSAAGGGPGLFEAALASGTRERMLGAVLARRRSGRPVPDDLAGRLGVQLGAFGDGVVRDDVDAQAAVRALGAAAFTFGRDVLARAAVRVDPDPAEVDLIQAERIEHQRWGAARSKVGDVVGTLAQAGVGAIIAGGVAAYARLAEDRREAAETVGGLGQGSTTYEVLASSIASVSEIRGAAVDVLDVLAGIIGISSALTWLITTDNVGAVSPSIALEIVGVTSDIDVPNKLCLQPLVLLFRALHGGEQEIADIESAGARQKAARDAAFDAEMKAMEAATNDYDAAVRERFAEVGALDEKLHADRAAAEQITDPETSSARLKELHARWQAERAAAVQNANATQKAAEAVRDAAWAAAKQQRERELDAANTAFDAATAAARARREAAQPPTMQSHDKLAAAEEKDGAQRGDGHIKHWTEGFFKKLTTERGRDENTAAHEWGFAPDVQRIRSKSPPADTLPHLDAIRQQIEADLAAAAKAEQLRIDMQMDEASAKNKSKRARVMTADDELARLRAAGDLAGLVDALGMRGARALEAGEWDAAIPLLDEAAAVSEVIQRPAHAAHALIGVVMALRASGRHEEATATARRAVALAPGGPSKVGALTALGECLRAAGDHEASLAAFTDALAAGRAAGLLPFHQAALLRRRGEALRALGRPDDATAALTEAIDAYRRTGADQALRDTLIERAAALVDADDASWIEAITAGRAAAEAAGDDARLAGLAVLEATRAAAAGDPAAAITCAERARQHALDGDAPLAYTAAAIALADLHDRAGERVAAYAALAVGCVTLGNRLDQDTAAAWFHPTLTGARTRWGAAAFQSIKDAFYRDRR